MGEQCKVFPLQQARCKVSLQRGKIISRERILVGGKVKVVSGLRTKGRSYCVGVGVEGFASSNTSRRLSTGGRIDAQSAREAEGRVMTRGWPQTEEKLS